MIVNGCFSTRVLLDILFSDKNSDIQNLKEASKLSADTAVKDIINYMISTNTTLLEG